MSCSFQTPKRLQYNDYLLNMISIIAIKVEISYKKSLKPFRSVVAVTMFTMHFVHDQETCLQGFLEILKRILKKCFIDSPPIIESYCSVLPVSKNDFSQINVF